MALNTVDETDVIEIKGRITVIRCANAANIMLICYDIQNMCPFCCKRDFLTTSILS